MDELWDPTSVLELGGLSLPPGAEVTITGHDPVLECRHHAGEAAACAAALAAAWAARFGETRGLPPQSVRVDAQAAAATLVGFMLQSSSEPIDLSRSFPPVTGLFGTADDRLIHLHGGFRHLEVGTARLLGSALDRASLAAAVATWEAGDLEDALAEANLCGAIVRTPCLLYTSPSPRD